MSGNDRKDEVMEIGRIIKSEPPKNTSVDQQGKSERAVFGDLLLVKMILSYAIREDDGNLSVDNIRNLRSVRQDWKEEVTKILRRNQEPLYNLRLEQDSSQLDRFAEIWTSGGEQVDSRPTFCVHLTEEFFRIENYRSFLNFLRQCGGGLVKLELDLPVNGGTFPGALNRVQLPVLAHVKITFSKTVLKQSGCESEEVYFQNEANLMLLMRSLLTESQSIKRLEIFSKEEEDAVPKGIKYVELPQSVTYLELKCDVRAPEMELLLENQLQNLTKLFLTTEENIPRDALVKVLQKFSSHLKWFTLEQRYFFKPPKIPCSITFPKMDTLEKLHLENVHYELEAVHPPLDLLFPKLKTLWLYGLTPEMMRNWIEGDSELPLVEELGLELVDDKIQESQYKCNALPISVETLTRAHLTFANVRDLSLTIAGMETGALRYVFKGMGRLTKLTLEVIGTESMVRANHWDSVLTGMPVEFVKGLALSPSMWDIMREMEIKMDKLPLPSIRLLSELENLNLFTKSAKGKKPLISDLAFIFALLKMPRLQYLVLTGRFQASEGMVDEWKKKGGKIKYSESE